MDHDKTLAVVTRILFPAVILFTFIVGFVLGGYLVFSGDDYAIW